MTLIAILATSCVFGPNLPAGSLVLSPMILELLRESGTSLPYAALTALRQQWPEGYILETQDTDFDWQNYAFAGLCHYQPVPAVLEQAVFAWSASEEKPTRTAVNGLFEVSWQGQSLTLLQLQRESPSCGAVNHMFVVAATEELARGFFTAVCQWNTMVRDEVMVFQEGYWSKDKALFQSIQGTKLEALILPPGLKEAIRGDAASFFESRERYARFNIPWKRGLMLLGPPGNGKTHMIQGLINDLKKPCLYVRSLKARYSNEDLSIRQVFEEARDTAPCILVMEDIDALITDETRSYFLNELDGFRKNEGLLVIATTNHPERLDPAIVDRPSRFDRKYHFDLPAIAERQSYLEWWNPRLDSELRLSESGVSSIADATEGFSFAYLKELVMASTMAWVNAPSVPMDATMAEQVRFLREQMATTSVAAEAPRATAPACRFPF